MDLTVALIENPPSKFDGEDNGAEDNGMIVRNSKRAKFMGTYYHQNFSMADSVIFYIAKNPKSWRLCQKMVKTCKYFFVKNPILVIPYLSYYGSQWTIEQTPYDINQTMSTLWIAQGLTVSPAHSVFAEAKYQSVLTSIIPKVYRCDVAVLSLLKQVIFYHALPLLTSSAKDIIFDEVVVKHEDGSNVEVQNVVEIASNATWFDISHPTITSKTMEELLKIPHFSTLRHFALENVPEVFDIEAFYVHMKKNETTCFRLFFDESISAEYVKRLVEITDEIIVTKEFHYKPAFFRFHGLDYQRRRMLYDICCSLKIL
uniref:Uncharacterized protein n=1 Tax=Panagrolaimus davidi TaxID=227884 RepID=A0A914Q2B4_9BILA